MASDIDGSTSVAEIVKRCPSTRRIFDAHGLKGCGGEHGPTEPLSFFAAVHGADLDELVQALRDEMTHPDTMAPAYRPGLEDFIYRRFFRAGIVIVLSVGCLWGAINLLEISRAQTFLQLGLLSSIHAHAHAMIFGWVGMFVMGFAYQAFPRFQNVPLWRPALANASFVLMLGGIVCGMTADLLIPRTIALLPGVLSAVAEITAVTLFLLILYRTARPSQTPRTGNEKFLAAGLLWFWIGTVLEAVFFFAKATAANEYKLVMRIALIDGPLRDIQLFGFAGSMIAGVSQRLIPRVYGLAAPARNAQSLLFVLMNGSLVLDIVCYLLLLTTQNIYFGFGLEAAYLLMALWPMLLARQLGIFSAPSRPDRTFKFVRAACIWLILACAMLPFFLVYGIFTHQVFAHAFMGSHRHAYTVGFISLMIMGVSSRVTPILSGIDAKRLSSLWGPFLLINVGCAGRVVLQILTDFIPSTAYPLLGFTGFIELVALIWWGAELWKVMLGAPNGDIRGLLQSEVKLAQTD